MFFTVTAVLIYVLSQYIIGLIAGDPDENVGLPARHEEKPNVNQQEKIAEDEENPTDNGESSSEDYASAEAEDDEKPTDLSFQEKEDYETLLEKGKEYHKEYNYHKAIEQYSAAYEIAKDFRAINNRALCYRLIGNYDQAIKDCDRALSMVPERYSLYLIKGNCLTASGRLEEALVTLKKGFEKGVLKEGFRAAISKAEKVQQKLTEADQFIKKDYKKALEAIKVCCRLAPGCSAINEKKDALLQLQ